MAVMMEELPKVRRRPRAVHRPPERLRRKPEPEGAERFMLCRSLGHSWNHLGKIHLDDPDAYGKRRGVTTGAIGYRSNCINCGMGRIRWIGRSGSSTIGYRQPDGYAQHGSKKLNGVAWRKKFYLTLMEE